MFVEAAFAAMIFVAFALKVFTAAAAAVEAAAATQSSKRYEPDAAEVGHGCICYWMRCQVASFFYGVRISFVALTTPINELAG